MWAKKTRPLRLTAHVFKTPEPIYMILVSKTPGSATVCYKFDQCRINTCVQNKAALQYAKIMQISLGIRKMWTVKLGLVFSGLPGTHTVTHTHAHTHTHTNICIC